MCSTEPSLSCGTALFSDGEYNLACCHWLELFLTVVVTLGYANGIIGPGMRNDP